MQGKSAIRTPRQTQTIRRMVITAMLSAVTALLAFTPVGMIMLPPPLAAVTLVHIPVLVAVLIEGPWVGLSVAFVFGLCSFIRAWETGMVGLTLFFRNPLVSILPRLIIPLTAWGVYVLWNRAVKNKGIAQRVGVGVASAVGAITNTVLCLGAIMILYGHDLTVLVNNLISLGGADNVYTDNAGAWLVAAVGVPNGIAEAVVAAIIVPMIKVAVDAISRRGRHKSAGVSGGAAQANEVSSAERAQMDTLLKNTAASQPATVEQQPPQTGAAQPAANATQADSPLTL